MMEMSGHSLNKTRKKTRKKTPSPKNYPQMEFIHTFQNASVIVVGCKPVTLLMCRLMIDNNSL